MGEVAVRTAGVHSADVVVLTSLTVVKLLSAAYRDLLLNGGAISLARARHRSGQELELMESKIWRRFRFNFRCVTILIR